MFERYAFIDNQRAADAAKQQERQRQIMTVLQTPNFIEDNERYRKLKVEKLHISGAISGNEGHKLRLEQIVRDIHDIEKKALKAYPEYHENASRFTRQPAF